MYTQEYSGPDEIRSSAEEGEASIAHRFAIFALRKIHHITLGL
jgi:hypothetical protein